MDRRPQDGESDRPPPRMGSEPTHAHFIVAEPHPRARRWAAKLGVAAATTAAFVAATAAGVVLHVGLPPARRLATAAVNQILTETFRGKINVLRVEHLGLNEVSGAVVTLTDPNGERVALVEGVRARIALGPLLASILTGADLRIRVTALSIDHIDVLLREADDGGLTIAEALQPAKEGPPPPSTNSGGLDLTLARVSLAHAWIHGGMKGLPLIDADVDGVAGSFAMTPAQLRIDVPHLGARTRGMPNGADVAANVEAHLVLPSDAAKATASAALAASVGGIDLRAHGTLDGKQVDAVVDVPPVAPSQLDRILGRAPIHQPAAVHAEVHGALPHLDPIVHLSVGEGTIDLGAHLTLPSEGQSDTLARLALAARDLDARALSTTAGPSRLGLDAAGTLRLSAEGAADGTYEVHALPGSFAGQPTPSADLAGTFAPEDVRGKLHVAEPGMPTDVIFDVDPGGKGDKRGPRVAFGARIDARDLSRVPPLAGALRGRAIVEANGKIDLGAKRVSARMLASLAAIDAGSVAIDQATMTAKVEGSFDAPAGTLSAHGQGLRFGNYAYPHFTATANGGEKELHVDAALEGGRDAAVTAKGTVETRSTLVRDVEITLAKDKDTVTARVATAHARGGTIDVEGIRLEGAGAPLEGDVHLRPGAIHARATSAGLDLATLFRVAEIKSDLREGKLGLDVDLEATRHTTKGHADVTLHGGAYEDRLRGLDATLAASFDRGAARVHLDARDAANDTLTLDTEDAHLAAGALDPRAWTGATGRVHVDGNVDLATVRESTGGALPFDDLRGRLQAKIDLARNHATQRPTIALDGSTKNLVFTTRPSTVPNGDGTVTVVGRAYHAEELDARVRGSLDAETGKAELSALLGDRHGKLLEASAATTLPMTALLEGESQAALLETPVRAHVAIPIRSIGDVPALFGWVPARGDFGLTLDAEGTAKEPHLRALINGRNVTDADDPTPVPISFDLAAIYDGTVARTKIVAWHDRAQVMDVVGNLALNASDVLAGGAPPWEADAEAHFAKFPIGSVSGFANESQIDGNLSGTVALHNLHRIGALDVDLDLADVNINGAKFGDTKATVRAKDGALDAGARIAQPDGFADVHLATGMVWGDAVTPTLDAKRPIDVALKAKNFRIAMFAPFVRSVVSELDGRLNADTKLHVAPGMKDGTMDGAIVLAKGLFESPAVGEEFHNLCARIYMKPWGVWNVAEISADGTSGHFTASATAHVDGLRFQAGEAHLRIGQKDKLPLAMQGMELGTVWGRVDAKGVVAANKRDIAIDVSVPDLHITLPQSIAHGVQSTDPDPTIKVGSIEPGGLVALLPVDGAAGALPPTTPPSPPKRSASAEPAAKIHIATHLGPDLEIRRDTTLRAYVSQGPTVDIGGETKISGKIAIPRGYIELQGKRFQIEKGTVNFTGQEPDNPVVVATAAYETSDGTKVFADFVGPVKSGKLTLRSEPALSQNEILALLLFGSADGTFGQSAPPGQQGNGVTQAASLAGGVVTEGLNKAISGVAGVEVQTKVDTQQTGDPRPELEVALSREVSATIIYNLGVPPPGQNPDDTLLLVDWRFSKRYETQATVGDKGTSILDLIWKYRY